MDAAAAADDHRPAKRLTTMLHMTQNTKTKRREILKLARKIRAQDKVRRRREFSHCFLDRWFLRDKTIATGSDGSRRCVWDRLLHGMSLAVSCVAVGDDEVAVVTMLNLVDGLVDGGDDNVMAMHLYSLSDDGAETAPSTYILPIDGARPIDGDTCVDPRNKQRVFVAERDRLTLYQVEVDTALPGRKFTMVPIRSSGTVFGCLLSVAANDKFIVGLDNKFDGLSCYKLTAVVYARDGDWTTPVKTVKSPCANYFNHNYFARTPRLFLDRKGMAWIEGTRFSVWSFRLCVGKMTTTSYPERSVSTHTGVTLLGDTETEPVIELPCDVMRGITFDGRLTTANCSDTIIHVGGCNRRLRVLRRNINLRLTWLQACILPVAGDTRERPFSHPPSIMSPENIPASPMYCPTTLSPFLSPEVDVD